MSRSRRRGMQLELGHDAFLDIVANLVGILIILVVVLGTQSQQVIEEIQEDETKSELATDSQLASLNDQASRAAAAQADSDRLESRIRQFEKQVEARREKRGLMLDLLAEAKAAWDDNKRDLDKRSVAAAERKSERNQAQEKLAALRSQRKRLEEREDPVVAVDHLPTPMAKTVFGDEIHFRLKDNRLSLVPIQLLLNEIRRDFSRMVGSSRDGQFDAAVGPVRGYVAKYAMSKNNESIRRGGQVGVATRIQLVGMMVEPLEEPHGQPIEKVLAESSQLDIELAGRDPDATTITVWVYPDSFASFRKLKEHLYARGFAAAARPLPKGQPIMGGPQGSRSRAQ